MKTLKIIIWSGIVIILGIPAALILVYLVMGLIYNQPVPAFKRLLSEPIPQSVSIVKHWGHCGLASSSEYIYFQAHTNDVSELLRRVGFIETDPFSREVLVESGDTMYGTRFLSNEIMTARHKGINASRLFVVSRLDGASTFTLALDSRGTNALFHYMK